MSDDEIHTIESIELQKLLDINNITIDNEVRFLFQKSILKDISNHLTDDENKTFSKFVNNYNVYQEYDKKYIDTLILSEKSQNIVVKCVEVYFSDQQYNIKDENEIMFLKIYLGKEFIPHHQKWCLDKKKYNDDVNTINNKYGLDIQLDLVKSTITILNEIYSTFGNDVCAYKQLTYELRNL